MFNNHFSDNKQKCRDLVAEQVSKLEGEVNVFTLPSTNFILEKTLLKKPGVCLYGAENNLRVYKDQGKNTISKQMVLKKGDGFDVIKKSKKRFDVVWMDLCSPLRHSVLNNILSLVQSNSLADSCYFNVTIACAREMNYQSLLSFYKAKNLKHFRDKIFPQLVKQFASSCGRECKLIKTINYKESGRAIPMKMLTFKIN